MGKRLIFVLTLVLAVAMVGAALTYAGGRGFRSGDPRHRHGGGPFADLTEDQRAEIQALVKTQRDAGATRAEIRAAVRAKLEEWGMALPEKQDLRPGCGDGPFAILTEAQRTAIREMVEGMKAEGASREDIRAAVRAKLEEWGMALRERPGPFADLTEAQRTEIKAVIQDMVTTMKAEGASREDIRAAVRDMLSEKYDIELPAKQGLRHGHGRRGFRGPCPAEESAGEPEETAPEEISPSAKLSATTAVQSARSLGLSAADWRIAIGY